MDYVLAFFAVILSINSILLLVGIFAQKTPLKGWNWVTLVVETGLLGALVVAASRSNWQILSLGLAISRLTMMAELAVRGWYLRRPPSPLLTVNFLLVIAALVTLLSGWWAVLMVAFFASWFITLRIMRRLQAVG
ncbi:MAG: hypothetical protein SF053_00135 [Bacteroidia bacterium]|nr:hypothetical protein [Bacteroidia bacterium]